MSEDVECDRLRESMINARQRSAVIKTRYISFRSAYPSGLVLAVEGDEDKIVYSHWVTRAKDDFAYEFFVCGGKRAVARLKKVLEEDSEGFDGDILFLVDRDFDELAPFTNASRVYMLDRYSIENHLVSRAVLEQCLCVAFPCHGEAAVREAICSLFDKAYSEFLSATAPVNLMIFIGRRLGYDLDGKLPEAISQMAHVTLQQVTAVEHDPSTLVILNPEPDANSVEVLSVEFHAFDPAERFRGKYALKFFYTWLQKLCDEFKSPVLGVFGSLANGDSRIRHDELSMGSFAAKAPIPAGLYEFLQQEAA